MPLGPQRMKADLDRHETISTHFATFCHRKLLDIATAEANCRRNALRVEVIDEAVCFWPSIIGFGTSFFKRLTCNVWQVASICWQGSDTETMELLEEESLNLNFESPNFDQDFCGTIDGTTGEQFPGRYSTANEAKT